MHQFQGKQRTRWQCRWMHWKIILIEEVKNVWVYL
jgi:hypothetical protein